MKLGDNLYSAIHDGQGDLCDCLRAKIFGRFSGIQMVELSSILLGELYENVLTQISLRVVSTLWRQQ
jgi:hypothetical protein